MCIWEKGINPGCCKCVASVCVFLLSFHAGKPLSNNYSNFFYKYWRNQTTVHCSISSASLSYLLNIKWLFFLARQTFFYLLHVLVMVRTDIRLLLTMQKTNFHHICNREVQGDLHMFCWPEKKIGGLRLEGSLLFQATTWFSGRDVGGLFLWNSFPVIPSRPIFKLSLSFCAFFFHTKLSPIHDPIIYIIYFQQYIELAIKRQQSRFC